MTSSWFTRAVKNIGSGIWGGITFVVPNVLAILWDIVLTIINIITPKKPAIALMDWPEYVRPTKGDSRSPCPALNALSNHGVFPHDGRGITFKQMAADVQKYYNFSPTFCFVVCDYMARSIRRKYSTDSFDLSDFSVHNAGIEHDGSFARWDTVVQPNQGVPADELIKDSVIAASKDGKKLTSADFSRILTARFAHSKQTNGQFSLSAFQTYFGAINSAALVLAMGGDLADIKTFLLEERIPQGWTSKVRSRMGLTMTRFNLTSFKIVLGVDPSWKKVKSAA